MTPATPEEQQQFNQQQEAILKAQKELEAFNRRHKAADHHRLIAFALLEAAMRYREGHWHEDVERYRIRIEENEEKSTNKAKGDKGYAKRVAQRMDQMVLNYKTRLERMNHIVYQEIKYATADMTEHSKGVFDNLCALFGDLMVEFNRARVKGDLLNACKMYNLGYLDEAIRLLKEGGKNNDGDSVKLDEEVVSGPEENVKEEIIDGPAESTEAAPPETKLSIVKDDPEPEVMPGITEEERDEIPESTIAPSPEHEEEDHTEI